MLEFPHILSNLNLLYICKTPIIWFFYCANTFQHKRKNLFSAMTTWISFYILFYLFASVCALRSSPAIHRSTRVLATTQIKFNHSVIKAIADRIEETSKWEPGITYIEMGANNGAWTDRMMNKMKEEGKNARYGIILTLAIGRNIAHHLIAVR